MGQYIEFVDKSNMNLYTTKKTASDKFIHIVPLYRDLDIIWPYISQYKKMQRYYDHTKVRMKQEKKKKKSEWNKKKKEKVRMKQEKKKKSEWNKKIKCDPNPPFSPTLTPTPKANPIPNPNPNPKP